ncbi:hypothetical protein SAMN04487819_1362 [Actinopolyspora alba]|uniref:Uncharacterized protein n=1 Tax=Actinopolyspora alba TaxID=673379 RepID=A0A1I2CR55_9ACTN|nr:hypothetical protein [Actinopolyspora alba]SFE70728.1 hypothetical protein SAMN04487819_1362 [Actinopolyspora alba]
MSDSTQQQMIEAFMSGDTARAEQLRSQLTSEELDQVTSEVTGELAERAIRQFQD